MPTQRRSPAAGGYQKAISTRAGGAFSGMPKHGAMPSAIFSERGSSGG